jgi:hypothetical protein
MLIQTSIHPSSPRKCRDTLEAFDLMGQPDDLWAQ